MGYSRSTITCLQSARIVCASAQTRVQRVSPARRRRRKAEPVGARAFHEATRRSAAQSVGDACSQGASTFALQKIPLDWGSLTVVRDRAFVIVWENCYWMVSTGT